jgi:prepilin-type N-terminal cleavage/methylation domain-containing protein
MHRRSTERGFTLTELLVASTVTLLVIGAALTTFKNALQINDSAAQLADTNQNLRAGTNQLIRDLMQACRIIGAQGIDMPAGGVTPFVRPGPAAGLTFNLVVDDQNTLNLPCLTTGYQLGATINGSQTDMVTIMTVDEFMPVLTTLAPATTANASTTGATMAADGSSATLPATSLWLLGDPTQDSPPIQVGDLVLFKGASTTAIQTITSLDTTHIYFATNDYFHFNQRAATTVPINQLITGGGAISLFRALMITYYVDNTTTPGTPRLTRLINHFTPQALAGVVEDMDLTYDLVDSVSNPVNITTLPYTDPVTNITYNSNQIRKVNIHVGVRSEIMSNPVRNYVRNHMSTSVDVRSLASVERY